MNWSAEGSGSGLAAGALFVCVIVAALAASCDPYAIESAVSEAVAGLVLILGLIVGLPAAGFAAWLVWAFASERISEHQQRRTPTEPEPVRELVAQVFVCTLTDADGRTRELRAATPDDLARQVRAVRPGAQLELPTSRRALPPGADGFDPWG